MNIQSDREFILLAQDSKGNFLIEATPDACKRLNDIKESGISINDCFVTPLTPMAPFIAMDLRLRYINCWKGPGMWFININWRELVDELTCYNLRTGERRVDEPVAA